LYKKGPERKVSEGKSWCCVTLTADATYSMRWGEKLCRENPSGDMKKGNDGNIVHEPRRGLWLASTSSRGTRWVGRFTELGGNLWKIEAKGKNGASNAQPRQVSWEHKGGPPLK